MRIGSDPFTDMASRVQNIQSRVDNSVNENDSKTPFSEILQITMTGSSDTAKELSAKSREETTKVLIGEEDNLVDNMVAGQKSTLQFELNLAVRNKVLDAYNEIMKTQV
jgi:flagellar hook-basal body complex protein FliE